MNFLNIKYFSFLVLTSLFLTSCNDDDVVIENQGELITTVTYELTPANGGETVTLQFQDLDGSGSNAATITGGTLATNTSYTGAITLLDESVSPAENITLEIEEEAEDHQLFFDSSIEDVIVNYADTDADGFPIGLSTTLVTGGVGTGSITIVLRHEPNKTAALISNDSLLANAGGETDVEVTIDLSVE